MGKAGSQTYRIRTCTFTRPLSGLDACKNLAALSWIMPGFLPREPACWRGEKLTAESGSPKLEFFHSTFPTHHWRNDSTSPSLFHICPITGVGTCCRRLPWGWCLYTNHLPPCLARSKKRMHVNSSPHPHLSSQSQYSDCGGSPFLPQTPLPTAMPPTSREDKHKVSNLAKVASYSKSEKLSGGRE